jgi:hypothetical protein
VNGPFEASGLSYGIESSFCKAAMARSVLPWRRHPGEDLDRSGIQPNISPTEWLGTSGQGVVTFNGDVARELLFTIGFRTRLGNVGGFFFSVSRTSKPMFAASGSV